MDWAHWQLVNGSKTDFYFFKIEEYTGKITEWFYTVKMYIVCVGLITKF